MLTLQQQTTLKELLKQANITQTALAKRLNVSRTYLSTIVNKDIDDISLTTLRSICTALGYTLSITIQA